MHARRQVGTDLGSFWTVSSAVMHGDERAIYSPDALAVLEQAVLPQENFLSVPGSTANCSLARLSVGFFPYLWSLASWLAVGAACYLTVLWHILPQPLTL
jgi:hypothetical protein